MNERSVNAFLAALRQGIEHLRLYPAGHPFTMEALDEAAQAATAMVGTADAVVLTIVDDTLFGDRLMMAHTSLEMNGLLRTLQSRGINSLVFENPVLASDVADLAAFVSGVGVDVPAAGTIRLNERPFSLYDMEQSEVSGLRTSYVASLDVLRSVGAAVELGGDFEMSGAVWAVENLLEQSMAQPGAALLLATVRGHDEYTFYHSINTCILSLAMGRLVGLSDDLMVPLGVGALLHDIGKLGVSTSVLNHPGRLAPEQWAEIKLHPQEGAQAILAASSAGQDLAAAIALQHHARFDGTGYPKLSGFYDHGHAHDGGSRRSPLHVLSRLVSVADTYDAITTRRSYRRAETPNRALHVLLLGAGTSYDPDFVRTFIHMMGVYPPGSLLRLRGGELVLVTHSDDGPDDSRAVLIEDATGSRVDPEPFPFRPDDVVEQLLADRADVDPDSVIEQISDLLPTGG